MSRFHTVASSAFYVFGSVGKFFIEVGIIGFLLGTCIAFFVVMGDLGPQIIAEITGTKTTDTMRTSILMALALFCVLPLGLLRNVDSLNGVSKATIGFYFCLILKIILVALPHLFSGDWLSKVELWKFDGILQCTPIFAMALSCQTQLFEIYQVIPNASLEKMNRIVGIAVNICTCVYICVGLFGYVAFSSKPFTGNILLSFIPSASNSAIKIGFILSLAFSFPLVIFPCRASLYSLLYKGGYTVHDGVGNYIPEGKFKSLTLIIVFTSLVIGIMIPNIEVVLGLVGSTIGVMICVMFPVTSFICISQKNTSERVIAQVILFLGIIIMVLSTYTNLYAADKIIVNPITMGSEAKAVINNKFENVLKEPIDLKETKSNLAKKDTVLEAPTPGDSRLEESLKRSRKKYPKNVADMKSSISKDKNMLPVNGNINIKQAESPQAAAIVKEIRHEPPQPIEPAEIVEQASIVDNIPKVTSQPEAVVVEKAEEVDGKQDVHQTIEDSKTKDMKNEVEPVVNNMFKNKAELDQKMLETKEKNSDNKGNLDESIKIEDLNKLEKKIDDNIHKIEELAKRNNMLPNLKVSDDANKLLKNKDLISGKSELPSKNVLLAEPALNNIEGRKNEKKNDEVDIEAIKKEETELKEQEKESVKTKDDNEKVLIETLQKQNEVQKELVEQHRKLIMKVIETQEKQNEIVDKEKVEAVRRIESAAKKAIESIGGNEEKVKQLELPNEQLHADEVIHDSKNMLHEEANLVAVNKPIVDAAPLSYQLGLNNVNLTVSNNLTVVKEKVPLPLPLVMSQKAQNDNKVAENVAVDKWNTGIREKTSLDEMNKLEIDRKDLDVNVVKNVLKKPTPEDLKKKEEIKVDMDKNEKDALNAIRRDILSHELDRAKRDVDHNNFVENESKQKFSKSEDIIGNDENKICQDGNGKTGNEVFEMISNIDDNTRNGIENYATNNRMYKDQLEKSDNTKLINVKDTTKKSISQKKPDDLYSKLKISQMLSDPKLVSPDLSLLNVESLIPIKPQTRDLKQTEQNDD